jgi:hypothetical protein
MRQEIIDDITASVVEQVEDFVHNLDAKGEDRNEDEIREWMATWVAYAEEGPSFDPKGKYQCGTCAVRIDPDRCAPVSGKIDFESGSCRLYIHGPDRKEERSSAHQLTQIESQYGERPETKAFGCSRCKYVSQTKERDSDGRSEWCNYFGVHVQPLACCAMNEGSDSITPKEVNASDDVEWITVNGQHIPVKPGQSKGEAIHQHFAKRLSESDQERRAAYNKAEMGGKWKSPKDKKAYDEALKKMGEADEIVNQYKTSYPKGAVKEAFRVWQEEQNYGPLNKLIRNLETGNLSDAKTRALAEFSRQAQKELGKGKDTVTLYRADFHGGKGRANSKVTTGLSYSLSQKGIRQFVQNFQDNEESDKVPTIHEVKVSTDRIVSYYKQWGEESHWRGSDTGGYNAEQEVIVSSKPLKLGKEELHAGSSGRDSSEWEEDDTFEGDGKDISSSGEDIGELRSYGIEAAEFISELSLYFGGEGSGCDEAVAESHGTSCGPAIKKGWTKEKEKENYDKYLQGLASGKKMLGMWNYGSDRAKLYRELMTGNVKKFDELKPLLKANANLKAHLLGMGRTGKRLDLWKVQITSDSVRLIMNKAHDQAKGQEGITDKVQHAALVAVQKLINNDGINPSFSKQVLDDFLKDAGLKNVDYVKSSVGNWTGSAQSKNAHYLKKVAADYYGRDYSKEYMTNKDAQDPSKFKYNELKEQALAVKALSTEYIKAAGIGYMYRGLHGTVASEIAEKINKGIPAEVPVNSLTGVTSNKSTASNFGGYGGSGVVIRIKINPEDVWVAHDALMHMFSGYQGEKETIIGFKEHSITLTPEDVYTKQNKVAWLHGAAETSLAGQYAGSLWNGIKLTGFTGPEEEELRAMLSRIPPELLFNVKEFKSADELQAVHGTFYPSTKTIAFNPANFRNKQKFGKGDGWLHHSEMTVVHEVGHSLYDAMTAAERMNWHGIYGWRKGFYPGQATPFVESRKGWDAYTSDWTHKAGLTMPRYYSEKNPNECFADCFAYFILGKAHQIEISAKNFLEKFIQDRVHRYPKVSIESPTIPAVKNTFALPV